MERLSEYGIRLSSMSPSFLNSNSTSHTWPFSAVAELIDNASDPNVSAKQIWIDVAEEASHLCFTVTDNGSGMTPNKLHKMLSFGFTDKGSGKASKQAIGVYGNGFKSGSMRLGRDVLVFTKNGGCQSVGMLSQTYLENIKAQAIIVPIVPFNQQTNSLVVTKDSEASLAAILQHSIVTSLEHIHTHFSSIHSKKGTKILIWNIRRAKDGKPELDFETDAGDFRLPEIQIEELKKNLRIGKSPKAEENIPDMYYSLRAYLSILYLKPRIQIILRGKSILAKLLSKRLMNIEYDVYKPHFSKERVMVTFGLCPKNKEHYGIMMYHKNRLIKAYEKVGCQLKASGQRAGVGIIGVIECNFLKPAHNKQDFEYTKEYRLTLGALGLKLNEYWKEMMEKKAREREFCAVNSGDEGNQDGEEGPMWLQCDECLKWRSIPASHYNETPESWHCSQNPNPHYRSCSSPEEPEEYEDQLTPSYQKTHKKQIKRRAESLFYCVKKKQHLWEETQPDLGNPAEEVHPEKQKNVPETHSTGDTAQQTSHNRTPSQPVLFIQTAEVSQPCLVKDPKSELPPPEGGDREAERQKLAKLEKEAHGLRRLLRLEIPETSRGMMTMAESSAEGQTMTSQPSLATRDVGCQTCVAEPSTLSSSPALTPGHQGVLVHGPNTLSGLRKQLDVNIPAKKQTDIQSTEAYGFEDSRLMQENLYCLRNNVVVLLNSLLPQLDLAQVSSETDDIDNILQQIIEVNSLKQ
ncbi:MORC family CW-type zinc finger protein 3 [Aulostomus maculatus]